MTAVTALRAALPNRLIVALTLALIAVAACAAPGTTLRKSGNPILPGWYADPEGAVLRGRYWIFPTYSAPYDDQTFFDAFSS